MLLSEASADLEGLFARKRLSDVRRGTMLSPALEVDPYYSPVLSSGSRAAGEGPRAGGPGGETRRQA